jgi:hypothetical protein
LLVEDFFAHSKKIFSSRKMMTASVAFKSKEHNPDRQALPAAGNGSVPCRPPPNPLRRCIFPRPGPERDLHVPVPAASKAYLSESRKMSSLNMGFEQESERFALGALPFAIL